MAAQQIEWNNVLPQEWPKVLAWAAFCIAALIAACWTLFSFGYSRGKDVAQAQIETYKAAEAAKLPELTEKLVAVSAALRDELHVYDTNVTLAAKVALGKTSR